jgi:hypothetical protein
MLMLPRGDHTPLKLRAPKTGFFFRPQQLQLRSKKTRRFVLGTGTPGQCCMIPGERSARRTRFDGKPIQHFHVDHPVALWIFLR